MLIKKYLIIGGVALAFLLASFGAGLYTGYKIAMGKYSSALAKAGELYSESERINRELRISNTDLQRLNKESEITINKLRESLSQAGIGIGNIKDGNAEAKRLIRELDDILRGVEEAQ